MSFKCPSCNNTIFNRRIPKCEFCGAILPKELVFTEQEKESLSKEYRSQQAIMSRERNKRNTPAQTGSLDFEELNIIDTPLGAPVFLGELPSTIQCMKCGLSYDESLTSCNHCEGMSNGEVI